ncbi:MAG: PAS domain-containing protein, partial [Steroidobacteraceae bacterium]
MSAVALLCVVLALVAAVLLWLYIAQRRELKDVNQVSQQLQRIAIGGSLGGRVESESVKPELSALMTAINHLLTRAAAEREGGRVTPKLFAELGERIHEAVLVHRDVILYSNRQFAALVGADRVDLAGRRLGDLVAPEYAELVHENIRRRLYGEPAAERYEVEVLGREGQVSRLEITSSRVDYDGGSALLVTGVEILPTQTVEALRVKTDGDSTAYLLALNSLVEAVIATDIEGRITYINPAAERLTSTPADQATGRTLEEIVGLIDETDRRLLSDPVRQALTSGAAVTLGRRALLISRADAGERSIEL